MKYAVVLLFLLTGPTYAQAPFSCCAQVCAPVTGQAQPLVYPIATFTVPKPVALDELIGSVTVVNGPITAMAIVCGDLGNAALKPPGYFAIYAASQHLRTAEAGVLPPSGTYNLMVSATNAMGSAVAPITVIVP